MRPAASSGWNGEEMAVYLTRCDPHPDGWVVQWQADRDHEWKHALAAIKRLPYDEREYLPESKAWLISDHGMERIGRLFENLDEFMDLDEPPEPSPRGARIPHAIAQAFAALHLATTAPLEVVQASYRALSKNHHPDHGGDHRSMVAINNAYDAVLTWLRRS